MTLDANELAANRLALTVKDMQDAKRYVSAHNELLEKQESTGTSEYFDHCEAILVAAIVAYCRPFKWSRSKENADPKVDVNTLSFAKNRPDLHKLHKLIEDRRDKVIAHGEWEFRKTELLNEQYGSSVSRRFPIPEITTGFDLTAFSELIELVLNECIQRTYDLDRQTLSKRSP